jgi:preprotein translocase subunit SecE
MAEAKNVKPPRDKAPGAAKSPLPKSAATPPAKAARAAKPGKEKEDKGGGVASWWEAAVQFLREVKTEIKKVAWPPRRQAISSTGVVLALVILVSAFLAVVDFVLTGVVRRLIS